MNLEQLFRLYHKHINDFLHSYCKGRLAIYADDIEQDLWIQVHKKLSSSNSLIRLTPSDEWLPLLTEMAKNMVADRFNFYLRGMVSIETSDSCLPMKSAEEAFNDECLLELVENVTATFKDDEQAIVRYLLQGYYIKEVAQMLHKDDIAMRVFITRRNLKQRIRKQLVNAR